MNGQKACKTDRKAGIAGLLFFCGKIKRQEAWDFMVLEAIASINQAVNNFVWGIPAMVCIIGVGLLLSVRTGFLQIRKFPYAIKTTIGRMFRKKMPLTVR